MLSLSTSEGKDTELILQLTWHLFKHSTQFTHGREGFFLKVAKMLESKLNCVFFVLHFIPTWSTTYRVEGF